MSSSDPTPKISPNREVTKAWKKKNAESRKYWKKKITESADKKKQRNTICSMNSKGNSSRRNCPSGSEEGKSSHVDVNILFAVPAISGRPFLLKQGRK